MSPKKIIGLVLGATFGLFVMCAGIGAFIEATEPETKATPSVSPFKGEYPTPAAVLPDLGPPSPEGFKLSVLILDQKCFGSAGCSVEYRIQVSYEGGPFDEAKSWMVIYEVTGDEDGPQTGNFTLTGDQASVRSSERMSLASGEVEISARALSVQPN